MNRLSEHPEISQEQLRASVNFAGSFLDFEMNIQALVDLYFPDERDVFDDLLQVREVVKRGTQRDQFFSAHVYFDKLVDLKKQPTPASVFLANSFMEYEMLHHEDLNKDITFQFAEVPRAKLTAFLKVFNAPDGQDDDEKMVIDNQAIEYLEWLNEYGKPTRAIEGQKYLINLLQILGIAYRRLTTADENDAENIEGYQEFIEQWADRLISPAELQKRSIAVLDLLKYKNAAFNGIIKHIWSDKELNVFANIIIIALERGETNSEDLLHQKLQNLNLEGLQKLRDLLDKKVGRLILQKRAKQMKAMDLKEEQAAVRQELDDLFVDLNKRWRWDGSMKPRTKKK